MKKVDNISLLLLMKLVPILKKSSIIIWKLRYYKRFKRCLDLKKPVLFWDKIIWMSIYTDTTRWSVLADKYSVREYVETMGCANLLNTLYGIYESVEEISYESLPDSFVLKTTNGCASNILVKNRDVLDIGNTNKLLDYWLKFPYAELTGQLHYSKIKPRIIAERLMKQDELGSPLIDYKFYCFNGVPYYAYVISERIFNSHIHKRMMYDMEWNAHPDFFVTQRDFKDIAKPQSLEDMINYAQILSAGFPFVRVDFYEIDGKPIFGEMTFTPGTDIELTTETQKMLGELIVIP